MKQKKSSVIKIEWTKRVELEGEERERILKKAEKIMKRWDLKMPKIFLPLVFNFGYNDFKKIGHIEYIIANEIKDGYCGKFIFMFKGQRCPCHYHKKKHETFFVLKGKILMEIDKKKIVLKEGDVLPMDRYTPHTFKALKNSLIIEVSQPSIKNDSFFKDEKIGVI